MSTTEAEKIVLSSRAMEELFGLYVRQWSLAVGRVNFAKTLGVSTSRLSRAIGGATPSFDLAYRIHKICGVEWPAILTGAQATIGTLKNISKAEKDRDISLDDKAVEECEAHVRARIRDLVDSLGFMECCRNADIAPASLHYYLDTTRLSLALIWKMHLLTKTPYSLIAGGKESAMEKELAISVTDEKNELGRFDDLSESVVRLVERYVYNEMSEAAGPYIAHVEKLLKKKLTATQQMRVRRILTLYHDEMGNVKKVHSLVMKNWQKLKKPSTDPRVLLGHLTVTGHSGMYDHADKVANYILRTTDDPRIVSQVYRVLSEMALEHHDVYESAKLSRKAWHITMNAHPVHRPFILSQLEHVLATSAWAFGDYNDTLSRTRRLLASRITPFHIRRSTSELEFNVFIWLRNAAGATRSLKALSNCSESILNTEGFRCKTDLYRLRLLLLKRDQNMQMSVNEQKRRDALLEKNRIIPNIFVDSESIACHAVCMYIGYGDKKPMKEALDKILSVKGFKGGGPLYALPDFLEHITLADLGRKKLDNWREKVVETGLLNFNMTRPD